MAEVFLERLWWIYLICFLQIYGYEGVNLRQVILVDGEAKGMFKDATGEDDEEKFQLAAVMLFYMNTNSTGIYDGID